MQENPLKSQNAIYNIGDPFPQWSQMTIIFILFFLGKLFSFGRLLSQLAVMIPSYYYADSPFPVWSHSDLIWKPLGTDSHSYYNPAISIWDVFFAQSLLRLIIIIFYMGDSKS